MSQIKKMLIVSIFSLLFGGAMIVLFAHAVGRQQIVMQEGE